MQHAVTLMLKGWLETATIRGLLTSVGFKPSIILRFCLCIQASLVFSLQPFRYVPLSEGETLGAM
jgi:hypothetical protein